MILKLIAMIVYMFVANTLLIKFRNIAFILGFLFPIIAWFIPVLPHWYVFILAFITVSSALGYPPRIPVYDQPLYMRKHGGLLTAFENGLLIIGLIWMIHDAFVFIFY